MKNFIIFLFIYLVSFSLFSQIVSDRPDQTESAIVLVNNNLQIDFAKVKGFNNDLNYFTLGICWLFS